MKSLLLLVPGLVFVVLACVANDPIIPAIYDCTLSFSNTGIDHPKAADFQRALDEYTNHHPGVSMAFLSTSGNNWAGTSGYADILNDIPLEACHRTMIGSISKVITASTVLRMVDDNLLDLDDLLGDYLSGRYMQEIANANNVTVRQLLNHSSGIVDYLQEDVSLHFERLNQANLRLTPVERLAFIYGKSANFSPGERHSYSNTNFVLLGLLIEEISGLTLDQAISQYIFDPLGLTSARHGTPVTPVPEGTIRPYYSTGGRNFFDSMDFDSGDAATGDGGVAINMQDLAVFTTALFAGDLLSPAIRDEMVTIAATSDSGEGFGLSVSNANIFDLNAWFHSGSILGYHAEMWYFTELELSLCIGFNSSSSNNNLEDKKNILAQDIIDLIRTE